MAWPVGPSNGATTTVNGILYVYNSTSGSWSPTASSATDFNVGNITATGNLSSSNYSDAGNLTVGGNLTVTGVTTLTGGLAATAWTAYTPTWTTSGTAPSLGNGSLTGAYQQLGKTVFVRVHLTFGSTTTAGTGNWRMTLPVAAKSTNHVVMPATYLDNTVNWYIGMVNCEYDGNANYVVPLLGSSPSAAVTNTAPFTWGNTDSLTFNGSYEAA